MKKTLLEIAKEKEIEMKCNCDLDSWAPRPSTNHSWVCRIHKAAVYEYHKAQS